MLRSYNKRTEEEEEPEKEEEEEEEDQSHAVTPKEARLFNKRRRKGRDRSKLESSERMLKEAKE